MYKVCKTEESAMRQKMLEEHLLQALLAKPYEKITISALCQEAGVPRKAFYRYFSTMHDALLALIDHKLAASTAGILERWDGGDRINADVLEGFFVYWQSQKPFLDALTANHMWPLLLDRTAISINRRTTGEEHPGIVENFEEDIPSYFVSCGLMATVLRWHVHGYPCPPRTMAQHVAKLLTEPDLSLSKLLL